MSSEQEVARHNVADLFRETEARLTAAREILDQAHVCVEDLRSAVDYLRETAIADAFTPPNPFGQCCDSASATGGAYHAPDCHSVKA